MELKEFITNTLTQIAEGVQEAIGKAEGKGYSVNPCTDKEGNLYTIHFDLSVQSQKEGGTNIKVFNGSLSEKSDNRITFDVKMTLPCTEGSKNAAHQKIVSDHQAWSKSIRTHNAQDT